MGVVGDAGTFALHTRAQARTTGKELLGERLNGGILVGDGRIELLVQQVF